MVNYTTSIPYHCKSSNQTSTRIAWAKGPIGTRGPGSQWVPTGPMPVPDLAVVTSQLQPHAVASEPPCKFARTPSRPAGRSLPASVGVPAPVRRPLTLCAAATISPPPTRRAASTARLTRLLLSSDLLRVAALGGGWSRCLGSGFAIVVGGLIGK